MVVNGDNRQIIQTSWNKYSFGNRSHLIPYPGNGNDALFLETTLTAIVMPITYFWLVPY